MAKRTFLYKKQLEMGAKMIDFAGWDMPVQFSSIIDEHNTVREKVGLFDVSHMGEVFIKGSDSLKFLNSMVPQDINNLVDGKAIYCQLTNENAGLIDDLIIYRIKDNNYLLIINASRVLEDLNWISRCVKDYDVEIVNETHNYSLLAIQGPLAKNIMIKLCFEDLPKFFHIKEYNYLNDKIFISRTGYTGEDGFEIMVKNKYVVQLWDTLIKEGEEFGIKPIGLGARDTLRLEAALHLYGNDLDETTTPIEAGLAWSVAKNKIEDYNGKEIIMNQLKNGVRRELIGIKMLSRAVPRHGFDLYLNNEKIGIITSGSFSPTLKENIALAYVNKDKNICANDIVQVMIRERLYDAIVVERPFVTKNSVKSK